MQKPGIRAGLLYAGPELGVTGEWAAQAIQPRAAPLPQTAAATVRRGSRTKVECTWTGWRAPAPAWAGFGRVRGVEGVIGVRSNVMVPLAESNWIRGFADHRIIYVRRFGQISAA